MRGDAAHIRLTAVHEAGHAIASLKVGHYVPLVHVLLNDPGDGGTYRVRHHWLGEPKQIADSIKWFQAKRGTEDEVFVLLAGPTAEAVLLKKPLRHLGSRSDYEKCLGATQRLDNLASQLGVAFNP